MPITIPEFVQYQAPLFPLRGLWNTIAPEGDRFVTAEIDWGSPGLLGVSTVQFQLSGNSPVAFTQIAALSVDNSRCGSSVDFLFPDSGFFLTVPGTNQGIYPVFTNALMFYASAPTAAAGDITVFQILNSVPPPVAIQPAETQSHSAAPGVLLSANGATIIIPSPTTGTLQAFTLVISTDESTAGQCDFQLVDGNGTVLFHQTIIAPVGISQFTIPVTGIRQRFVNGINAVVAATAITAGNVAVNLYYSVP